MIRYGHLYGVIVSPGYVGFLLPNQYGVQATWASMPRHAGIVLSGLMRLATRVQWVEEYSIGQVFLPRACRVG